MNTKKLLTRLTFILTVTALIMAGCGSRSTPAPATTPLPDSAFAEITPAAQEFVDQLAAGEFAGATSRFDEKMNEALPQAKLEETWQQLTGQVGAYQKQLGVHTDEQQGYRRVFVTTQFENAVIDVMVVFDPQDRIAGLFFQPGQAPGATPQSYNLPEYVQESAFREVDVTVGSSPWALPGVLSLPEGSGPFPAVVLVHGSGPNDRDETIGPNKPFRDLAWGLASRGIAVLRYDKRTYAHGSELTAEQVANLTVQEETVEDALLAADLLRETEGIDSERIFVAGHSLGAMVAPRIGQADPGLAGLILLAGPTRPLEEVTLDQVNYIFNLDGTLSEKEQADLEALQTQVERVKDPQLSAQVGANDLPLGIPPAYWLDLRGYNPAEVAAGLKMPLFILQGGRDYQVSAEKDFPAWQAALAGKENASLKLYPDLNHLFISGEGMATPEEYNLAGHVSPEVIADLAEWVKSHS